MPTVPISVYMTLDPEVQEQMFRSSGQSDGFIKDCVYIPKLPADLPNLRHRIEAVVARMTSDTLNKGWDELSSRFDVCRVTNRAQIEHLRFSNLVDSSFFITEIQAESLPKPDEIGNLIEEVVDLAMQINLEVDSDDIQEQLDSHNQELTIHELVEEQDIERTLNS
ncbi:hypothetical protein TNCV_1587621 [Trichonephila clavipes]|uniref:Uncharacterized protein n=1 Tax=Trichonephila clavipes TaxID=2585209 RepID=A0A8X6RNF1_TRICX|nr:hypothetical protein TNCV_1587621 [Trichonephila clavipes]